VVKDYQYLKKDRLKLPISNESVKVEAKTIAIKATWTRELVTDLNSCHGLDIESEFDRILNKELRVFKRKKSINKILKN
jgi:hypothetical protein